MVEISQFDDRSSSTSSDDEVDLAKSPLDVAQIAHSIAPVVFDAQGIVCESAAEEAALQRVRNARRESSGSGKAEGARRGRPRREEEEEVEQEEKAVRQSDAGSTDDDDSLSSFGSDDERQAEERAKRRQKRKETRAARRRYRAKVAWAREAAAKADPAFAALAAEAQERRRADRANAPWWQSALSFLVADAPSDSDWEELSEYGSADSSLASSSASSSAGVSGRGALNLSDFSDIELGGSDSILALPPSKISDLGGEDDSWIPAWLTDAMVEQVSTVLDAATDTLAAAGFDDEVLSSMAATVGDADGLSLPNRHRMPRFPPSAPAAAQRNNRPAGFR